MHKFLLGALLLVVVAAVLALDASLNRAYVFYDDYRIPSSLWTLETFNLQSRASLVMARINSVSLGVNGLTGTTGRLVRWGTNGLAINANCRASCQAGQNA